MHNVPPEVDFESSRSPAKSESWNSPCLHCLAVLPTWQYCLCSLVKWKEIKRAGRLSHAFVHFVIDRASLFTNHGISGLPCASFGSQGHAEVMCWCPVFSPRRSPVFMGTDADEFGAYTLLPPLVCHAVLCCDVLVVVVVMCCGVVCLLLFATTLHNTTHHTTLPLMWVRVVCCGVCSGCVLYTNTPVNAHTPHNLQRHTYKQTPFYTNTDPQHTTTTPRCHSLWRKNTPTRTRKTTNDTEETENRQKTLTWIADGNSKQYALEHAT